MYIERKQDLSMYYFISDMFSPYTFVTVTDEFPDTNLEIPTISVENGAFTVNWYELGNRQGLDVRTWFFNVFAKNKSQRDDFAYLIKNELQNGVPVYDYDEGFPPNVSPTKIGTMSMLEIEVAPKRVFSELVSPLYYRSEVSVIANYNQI